MEAHVDYMLNPKFFNKEPSTKYITICRKLRGVDILTNKLSYDNEEILTAEIYAELETKGYLPEDLLAVTHTFIARKFR
jgi:hypothetical protein